MVKRGRFGHGTEPPAERSTVLRRAREVGIAGEVETLQMLVQAWRGGYERLVGTTPEGSQARALVTGALGSVAELSRMHMEDVAR